MTTEEKRRIGHSGLHSKESSVECLIPRTLFTGYYGPLPDRSVNLFLTDVVRISSGTFGVVYRANLFYYPIKKRDPDAGTVTTGPQHPQIVAIKRVLQDKRFKNRELEMIRILDHKNIVELKYYFKITDGDSCYLGLIMEFLPTSFYSYTRDNLYKSKKLPEGTLKSYAFQLLSAMCYIHEKNICHRDVKSQNILVDETRNIIKVCDFGSAKRLVSTEQNVAYICSRHYRAPELILGNAIYTTSIDIWACGCVLAEAITGHTLFFGNSSTDQLTQIIIIMGVPDPNVVKKLSSKFDHKVYASIIPKTLKKVLNCQYTNFISLLESMLTFSPDTRPSAKELLEDDYLSSTFPRY